ncbi:hypothetical protein Halru_1756 [Halovivax ruber XH-70]|uniref:DUF58 domain-containing protein n=1 Tax=Halovivax ruber (strain DSM 18193 / JCM 13892 / XH-70) TaxID=797302 RepID=L0I9V2_HALRX|nr:DUF58 domain-containing protein [Halovivax ruber]AGB16355.1 hypothetical protein Halru_1756 [Halovivax ruber XH-70]
MTAPINRYAYAAALFGAIAALASLGDIVAFSSSPALLTILGLAAIVGSMLGLGRAWNRPESTQTPEPERRVDATVPRQTAEEALREFGQTDVRKGTKASDRLGYRAIARETLVRYTGIDEDAAEQVLDEGTWTDDELVARYISGGRIQVADRGFGLLRRVRRNEETPDVHARVVHEISTISARHYGDATSEASKPRPDTTTTSDGAGQRTTDRLLAGTESLQPTETGHWWGVGSVALGLIGAGALLEVPGLLLAGTAAIGYAGYARSTTAGEPTIDVDRTVEPTDPEPGESVSVATTITNGGARPLVDVRVIDGVPGALQVTDGSIRTGTTLFPEESVTVEYTVEARPGTHDFDPVAVLVGDVSRSAERTIYVPAPTTLTCTPSLDRASATVPQRHATLQRTGHVRTPDGGPGTEFHSIREYRAGDPINRVDWNRHARTGELATIQFHEMHSSRVVLLIDARRSAYAAPSETAVHAVDRAVEAAGRIAADLLASGNSVGLAGIGAATTATDRASSFESGPCWLPPGSSNAHRLRIQRALTRHPQFSTVPPATKHNHWPTQLGKLVDQLAPDTELIFLSPLADFGARIIAQRLIARGHATTVVSPDPTTTETPETALAAHCRALRISTLHGRGVPVLDWTNDDSLDAIIEREAKRGSPR